MVKQYIFLGILLGILCGLIPGIHSNTIISVLNSFNIPDELFSYLIISLFGAYSVTCFIPSIFFGIPDDSSVLTVLPGQRLVKEGKGMLALKTVLFSILLSCLISVLIFPFSLDLFPIIYSFLRPNLFPILVLISLILILKTKKPIFSLIIFSLAGALGFSSFSLELEDPFLPLFTGMFAIAAIIAYKKSKIPEQKDYSVDLGITKYILFGIFGGFFADLLPGVSSPSQVAAMISIFFPITSLGYLATISSVSISEAVFAISTNASIAKSRIGAIVWLNEFSDVSLDPISYLTLFLLSVAITCILIYIFRSKISIMSNLNFSKFNIILAFYLGILVYLIDGYLGLIIFITASLLGYATLKLNIERTMLMGAVILPTIIYLSYSWF